MGPLRGNVGRKSLLVTKLWIVTTGPACVSNTVATGISHHPALRGSCVLSVCISIPLFVVPVGDHWLEQQHSHLYPEVCRFSARKNVT